MQVDVRDPGSIPGSGRSPGGGHGHLVQYSCQENPMDRGIWQAMVHVVAQSQTQLKQLSTHTQGSKIVDQGNFFMKKLKKKKSPNLHFATR